MTALRREIAALIAEEGPISIERYMSLALFHPRHGYYRSRDPFGAAGDFITAPDISQMFGELIGLWAVDCWTRMDRPARFNLVELGPGRGTLMADALRAARLVPDFGRSLDLHLVEISEVLRQRQGEALALCTSASPAKLSATWHERLASVPDGPLIVIANEFFDALPIRQYRRGSDGWHERLVGLDDRGALSFGLSALREPSLRLAAAEGAILEFSPEGAALARDLARRLPAHGGAALVIDYGHAQRGFGDTLQAIRRHGYIDPLALPGKADLTAHVDFAALADASSRAGAAVHGPVTQRDFLRALGIEARSRSLKRGATQARAAAIETSVRRLTSQGAGAMGTLFKALAIADPKLGVPAGFEA